MYTFIPKGVCSQKINIELDGNTIAHVDFLGGCHGNLKAISKLVEGKTVEEVTSVLSGITCHNKGTSCGDQLAKGLQEALKQS